MPAFFPRSCRPPQGASRHVSPIAILLVALIPMLASAQAGELVYEREFTLLAEAENTLRMRLNENDRLTIERPIFMTHAGRYEVQMPAGTHARMSGELGRVAIDSRALDQDIQTRAANEYRHVSDDEISRFIELDAQRQVVSGVEVISLEPWSVHFPDDARLTQLLELERAWYGLMDQGMKQALQQAGQNETAGGER